MDINRILGGCGRIHINYCLHERGSHGPKYLKLHGSVNWARCPECGDIVPYELTQYFSKYKWDIWDDETKNALLMMNRNLSDLLHCQSKLDNVPVLVPPTWNKTDYHGTLTNVWANAAEALGSARNIFVIGYSLPESDAFFRYLFALGTLGETRLKRFWVYDPNNTGEVRKRYENLLGRGITNRFEYLELPFSKAIHDIRENLNVETNRRY